jgi:transposase
MGEDAVQPTGGRDRVSGGDTRPYHDESPPARGRTTRGQPTNGKSRGGIRTKFHAVVTRGGPLVEGMLTGGQIPDVSVAGALSEDLGGCTVIADRGYDRNEFRREVEGNNNTPIIPGRKNRKEELGYDKETYKKRGLRERLLGKLTENRRLTVRYEQSDTNFLGFICIAFIKILLS